MKVNKFDSTVGFIARRKGTKGLLFTTLSVQKNSVRSALMANGYTDRYSVDDYEILKVSINPYPLDNSKVLETLDKLEKRLEVVESLLYENTTTQSKEPK